MINFFKKLYEPIRLGNEYRASKEYLDKVKENRPKSHDNNEYTDIMPFFLRLEHIQEIDNLRDTCQYWEEWTGSGYRKRENPDPSSRTIPGITCRSNPVTGKWEII